MPHDAMAQMFDAAPANDLPDLPNYNVCPTVQVATVTAGANGRRYAPMRWGFIPHWYKQPNGGPLLINARAETIAEKPAFKAACRERRCLIPASGFYEWTKTADDLRDPWYIFASDAAPLVMAAVWQDWSSPDGETQQTCAIVTTSANKSMSKIHHRMPVLLTPEQWPLWLGEAGHGAARLLAAVDDTFLAYHRVDRAVNSNRASGASLIEPLDKKNDPA